MLDEAYGEAIQRIDGQLAEDRSLARRALSWITYAQRPLTTTELCHALAIHPGDEALDNDNIYDVEDIISVCAGLVAMDEENSIIRLVHYTTQEYFEHVRLKWNPGVQEEIAVACLTYLSFDTFRSGSCADDQAFEQRLAENAFFDYSANYWSEHVRPVQRTISHLALAFLCDETLIDSTIQAVSTQDYKYRGDSGSFPSRASGLHLTARYGLLYLTERLLKPGDGKIEADSKDGYSRTPLSWAAEEGHEAVVKLLLETGKVYADSKDNGGRTPLHWAAWIGHEKIVESLVKYGAYINSTDEQGSTALHDSIKRDHQAVQELLIEFGADLDIKDGDNQTASDLAWSKKRLDSSTFAVDELATAKINQGIQAHCEILRRKDGKQAPLVSLELFIHLRAMLTVSKVIFRKKFDMGRRKGKYVRKCLLREYRTLQKLNHPFIVSYLGYEEDSSQSSAALYMEFCEGGDLHTRHVQETLDNDDDSDDHGDTETFSSTSACHPIPLQEKEVWSIVFQLAAAMAYLHHGLSIKKNSAFSFERHWKSVIHRDLKPENGKSNTTSISMRDFDGSW